MSSEIYSVSYVLEDKWSSEWISRGIFNADPDPGKPKIFITFPFPYMNGSLHLGHAYSASRLDVLARYYRMKGYNVLFPWAWHWTGEAVMGVVHRLEDGDQSIIERLIKLDGVEPSEIDKFRDPVYLVKYFTRKGKEDIIRLGLSIDWRREFHTTNIHPLFTKFVEWQIRKLRGRGFIVQEPHPVVWCPRDESPTGDHDRLEGVGVRPEEYVLVKFYIKDLDAYLVAGTFRPETLFGVTNIWVKPDANYVLAIVDGEGWIVSERAVEKLADQMREIEVLRAFRGSELVGLYAKAPYINRDVPVLPADFVDPNLVSGVVYSVPAHAPYDYAALMDLKSGKSSLLDEIREIVLGLEPISIISVVGYSEYPARDAVEKYGVRGQTDTEALEKATREVYSEEYHKGVMKNNCLDLAGVPVREAKDMIISILRDIGMSSSMYDLPERVVCRCGTVTHVKIIEDQWALKYSDVGWKELARKAVLNMNFYPEELRKMFLHYIDWYVDWPCTRKTGLGTLFPLDREWIVETLTDSTIYMAFYIIAKYYNSGEIDPTRIDDAFFDYVFFGVGDVEGLAKNYGLSPSLLKKIRGDFLYWYPVDIRGSGKDLVGNHLTFYIFHHVAIFDKLHWPRGISVNGYIKLEGKPMSKSTGNFISLRKAIELFGADSVRIGMLIITDGLEDPDVRLDNFRSIKEKIRNIPTIVREALERASDDGEKGFFEKLLLAKVAKYVRAVEDSLDSHRIAAACRTIFYRIPDALGEYLRMVNKPSREVVVCVIETWIKLLSLYAPFVAEEVWRNKLKRDTYIALESWPSVEYTSESDKIILFEEYAKELISDIDGIIKLVQRSGRKGFKVVLLPAPKNKWGLVKDALFMGEELVPMREFIALAGEYGVDRVEAAATYKILSRHFYGRYFKLRKLLESISWGEEYHFLERYFPFFLRVKYPDADLEVSMVSKAGGNYAEKAIRSMPLMPAIIVESS